MVRAWLLGPPVVPGVFGRPSLRFGSGREALPKVREWSGSPPIVPGVVERPYRWSGSDQEALSEGWDALPESGRVWRPSRSSGSCREVLPVVRE